MFRWGAFGAAVVMAFALAQSASSAVMIGNASTVVREVKSTIETRERVLIVDDDVFQDEEVSTGALSAARLIFKDGTNMSMGAQSRLKLTKVLFDPDPSKSKVAMKAAVGVFRMATGNLPSSSYQVATPVAAISVRGTIIELTVTGTGTTTVYVAKGAATVRSNNGDEVDLEAGESTTVRAEGAGDNILAGSPTDPSTPSEEFSKQMRAMTVALRSEEPAIDQLPGGGFFRPPGGTFNPFPAPPRAGNGGGGGGGGGGGSGGGNAGGGAANPPGNNPPASNPPGNGNNTGGSATVTAAVAHQEYTRIGTTSEANVTITRTDSTGLTEIVGTLDSLSGVFTGPGSGSGGVRLLQGGQMQFTYVFAPTEPGSYVTALPYGFPGYGITGSVELKGMAIGPVLTVATGGSGLGVAKATQTGPLSRSVTLTNQTTVDAPIDIVGATILSAYVQGAGSEFLTITGLEPMIVLGAGDDLTLTIAFDPTKGSLEDFLELALLDEIFLYIQTDLNAAFGSAGKLLQYKLSFVDDIVISIVAPPVGLALMIGGTLFLMSWRVRRRR